MEMKAIGDFIFSFWTFTTYSIPILQNYSTFPYNAFAILAIQYLHFLYFQVCMFLFLLSRLCSNNCLHKLSEYMYSSFPYWTNKFTLEKAFLQIAFGERKKKKGNVGLEFVAASNTSFKIMSGSRWKLLMRGMPYLRSKEKKLVPWVPRGLYQEKKNAWDDGTFSYHRKLCLMTKFSFKNVPMFL